LADISRIAWGAPITTLELFSLRGFHGSFGALVHRVERLEMDHLTVFQRPIGFQAADRGQVDGVPVFRTGNWCGVEDDLPSGWPALGFIMGIPSVSTMRGSRELGNTCC
jgi:hypothetical protein